MNLRKSAVISLAGHITVLSIFSFSFGLMLPRQDYPGASFYGAFLRYNQVLPPAPLNAKSRSRDLFSSSAATLILPKSGKEYAMELSGYHLKPQQSLAREEKAAFSDTPPAPLLLSRPAQRPSITFHPLLPYSFPLYFKDRQVAHVELAFNLGSGGLKKAIEVKRKISSGNLEVDLLTSRYISHYLFIRQGDFPAHSWQTVKIDLSAEND